MDPEKLRDYCLSKKGVSEEFPFNEDVLVFKVGGKIFLLADLSVFDSINLKCDPAKAELLRQTYPEVIPGYHMNKKHWNTVMLKGALPDQLIREWIDESYELVAKALPRSLQVQIGWTKGNHPL